MVPLAVTILLAGGRALEAQLRNLSRGGASLRLFGAAPLLEGDSLELHFRLPASPDIEPLQAVCQWLGSLESDTVAGFHFQAPLASMGTLLDDGLPLAGRLPQDGFDG